MPDEEGFLHPTELEQYQRCPKSYEFQYVQHAEPLYRSWYMLRGSIIHQVFEAGLNEFDQIFRSITADMESIGASQETIDKDRPKMLEQCRSYFQYIHRHDIQIIGREVPLDFEFAGRKFRCKIDALAKHEDTPKGQLEIHDYKTGVKWCYPSMNRKLQFFAYYYAAEQNSFRINRVFWGQTKDLERYKTDGKKAVKGEWKGQFLYPLKIQRSDYEVAKEQAFQIIRGIESGIFFTNNYMQQCKMCEFERKCPKFEIGIQSDNTFENASSKDKELEAQLLASIEKEKKK